MRCWQRFGIWMAKVIQAESLVAIWKRRIVYKAPEKVSRIHGYCNNTLLRWEQRFERHISMSQPQVHTDFQRQKEQMVSAQDIIQNSHVFIDAYKFLSIKFWNFRVIRLEIKTCWTELLLSVCSLIHVEKSYFPFCHCAQGLHFLLFVLFGLLRWNRSHYAATPQDYEKCQPAVGWKYSKWLLGLFLGSIQSQKTEPTEWDCTVVTWKRDNSNDSLSGEPQHQWNFLRAGWRVKEQCGHLWFLLQSFIQFFSNSILSFFLSTISVVAILCIDHKRRAKDFKWICSIITRHNSKVLYSLPVLFLLCT